ncbi:MAG TPA: CsiV family protein [Steroidobacteraceae bacterium]
MRLLRLCILILAACAIPAQSQQPAPANEPAYNIELIVFRTTTAQGGAENWSAQSSARGSFTYGGETSPGTGQVGRFVRLLPASAYQLTGLANKLRASGVYVPVAHVAWTQTASAWGTRAGFPLERLGANVEGLTGTVFLERGQFLHLGMTLSYAMPDPPAGLGAGPGTVFTLSETRRIRFYERNYYDHPAFGVIALVTPAQGGRPAAR